MSLTRGSFENLDLFDVSVFAGHSRVHSSHWWHHILGLSYHSLKGRRSWMSLEILFLSIGPLSTCTNTDKSKEFFTYEMFSVLFPANKTYSNRNFLFICDICRLISNWCVNDGSLAVVNYAIENLLCWKMISFWISGLVYLEIQGASSRWSRRTEFSFGNRDSIAIKLLCFAFPS